MHFKLLEWSNSVLRISTWLLLHEFISCQFYPGHGYFPRPYGGPSPYDFYHPKPHPPLSPANFIRPFPPNSLNGFYGPGLPPNDAIFAAGSPLPHFRQYNGSVPNHRDNTFISSSFADLQFSRDPCTTSSGDNGTCLSGKDCQMKNGIAIGTCADNFGVCCVFMSSCGATIRQNGTYFVNKGYPTGLNSSTSCQVIVDKSSPEVCQYRLDFEQFILAGPEPINHICNYDQFIVTGSSPVPIICGLNTGNHMYVDAGPGASGPIVLLIATTGAEFARRWKIRVTQISCPSLLKAEEGCLQYFVGVSGQIMSYNYEPNMGLHLSNQDYSICIRSEQNFCSIQYSQCPDTANNRSHSFALTGYTLGQHAVSSITDASACNTDWLLIPCAENVDSVQSRTTGCVDRICGGTLSAQPSTMPSVITSSIKPFRMYFHTNAVESPDMGNTGFCIRYVQQPCKNQS